MAEETAQLKRDSTMVATAEEGAAFLEKHGKVDEEAKTRAQQKQIEENNEAEKESTPKMERTTTMAATAKEGEEILAGAELGKTRAETAKQDEESKEDGDEKQSMQRTTTMEATAQEAEKILEAEGGLVDGTRSEAKQVQEAIKASEEEEEEEEKAETNGTTDQDECAKLKRKSTMEVTAAEGEEFLKKQKLSEPDGTEAAKEVEA